MTFLTLLRAAAVALSSATAAMVLVPFAGSFQGTARAAEDEAPWAVICADADNAETCRMEQIQFVDQTVEGQQKRLGKLLSITVLYVGARPALTAAARSVSGPA